MKKLSIAFFAVALCVLTGCQSIKPFAATVNGTRITADELEAYTRVRTTLAPSNADFLIHGTSAISDQLANTLLSELMLQKAQQAVLTRHGVNGSSRAVQKFSQFLTRSQTLDDKVAKAYGKLSSSDRSLAARLYSTRFVFDALDAGVKPTDSDDIICANIAQFTDEDSANSAVTSLKSGQPISSLAVPIETCYAKNSPTADPLAAALRNSKVGDIVGPVNVGTDQIGEPILVVGAVTLRQNLAFRDWPLVAMYTYQVQTVGPLSKELLAKTVSKVNPAFGRLATSAQDGASCQTNLICVVPPIDPSADPNQSQQQSPFG